MPSLCSGGHDAVTGLARCFFCKMVVHFHILFSQTGFGTLCQQEAFRGTSRATAFASGAATVVGCNGIPDHLIQALGRWSSSAFQLYIRTPADMLALLPSRLS